MLPHCNTETLGNQDPRGLSVDDQLSESPRAGYANGHSMRNVDGQDGMMNIVFTGFDSAWTDSWKSPGAIASIVLSERSGLSLRRPALAGFAKASRMIATLARRASAHIVAIDQPLIVPNDTGSRPVERAVRGLIGQMGGGMQPANRGKIGMFDDDAPIWPFLRSLAHAQAPLRAVGARRGRYVLEVYPALSIVGLFSTFLQRRKLPRYNPARKTFRIADWRLLCRHLAGLGRQHRIEGLGGWAAGMMARSRPRKADQDAVDAVICAIQAYTWWRYGAQRGIVIGDERTGYIVSAARPYVKATLRRKAHEFGVAINRRWSARSIATIHAQAAGTTLLT